MVRAAKIAVWKIEDRYFEKADEAEKAVRHQVVLDMLKEQKSNGNWPDENIASWIADNHDELERRVKAAMAGT